LFQPEKAIPEHYIAGECDRAFYFEGKRVATTQVSDAFAKSNICPKYQGRIVNLWRGADSDKIQIIEEFGGYRFQINIDRVNRSGWCRKLVIARRECNRQLNDIIWHGKMIVDGFAAGKVINE
jgi:hypothetical protein